MPRDDPGEAPVEPRPQQPRLPPPAPYTDRVAPDTPKWRELAGRSSSQIRWIHRIQTTTAIARSGARGLVFLSAADALAFVDAASGDVRWHADPPPDAAWRELDADPTTVLAVASTIGGVKARVFAADDGRLLTHFRSDASVGRPRILPAGFALAHPCDLSLFDRDGHLVATLAGGDGVYDQRPTKSCNRPVTLLGSTPRSITAAHVTADGRGVVETVDMATGAVLQRVELGELAPFRFDPRARLLVAGDRNGERAVVRSEDGRIVARRWTGPVTLRGAAVPGDELLLVTEGATMTALDARSLTERWSRPDDGPAALLGEHQVFVHELHTASRDGELRWLDPRTGAAVGRASRRPFVDGVLLGEQVAMQSHYGTEALDLRGGERWAVPELRAVEVLQHLVAVRSRGDDATIVLLEPGAGRRVATLRDDARWLAELDDRVVVASGRRHVVYAIDVDRRRGPRLPRSPWEDPERVARQSACHPERVAALSFAPGSAGLGPRAARQLDDIAARWKRTAGPPVDGKAPVLVVLGDRGMDEEADDDPGSLRARAVRTALLERGVEATRVMAAAHSTASTPDQVTIDWICPTCCVL